MTRKATAFLLLSILFAGILSPLVAETRDEVRGFSEAELDQMLAPIALYPDTVLSHVLIASTYPIEIVRAARWTREHPDLRGEAAVNAVVGKDWDPSVMALVAFPELLSRMNSDLDWTQRLGDAFLIQEEQVLDSIQRLRGQAYRSGHLRTTEQVRVVREREVIYIEPPRRQVVYVPVYDPRVVYGSWAWSSYPPVYWYPAHRPRTRVALYWGPSYSVPPAFFFSSFHWSRRQVVVVHHHHHYYRPKHPRVRTSHSRQQHHYYRGRDLARHGSAQRWQHDPGHRRGVAYHPAVEERHRRMQSRAPGSDSASSSPPARVADTRSNQREWAEQRRSETRLAERRTESAQRARSASSDTNRAAGRASSPERRAQSTPSSPASSEARSSTRRSAGQVERRLQERPGASRQASTDSRSGADQSAQQRRAPASDRRPAQTRPNASREGRVQQRSAPRQHSATPRASQSRPAPRSAPQRQSGSRQASPPSRQAPRAAPQRQSGRATPQRQSGSRQASSSSRQSSRAASQRRSNRRVD